MLSKVFAITITLAMLLAYVGIAEAYRVYIEAESAKKLDKPLEIKTDKKDAFGGKYIVNPNGTGDNKNAQALYDFDAPKDGTYYFWGRVISPSGSDDSYFWAIDNLKIASKEDCGGTTPGTQTHIWDPGTNLAWTWTPMNSRNCAGDPGKAQLKVDLKKGKHTLGIADREDGTELDGVLITDEALKAADIPNTFDALKGWATPVEPQGKATISWGIIKMMK